MHFNASGVTLRSALYILCLSTDKRSRSRKNSEKDYRDIVMNVCGNFVCWMSALPIWKAVSMHCCFCMSASKFILLPWYPEKLYWVYKIYFKKFQQNIFIVHHNGNILFICSLEFTKNCLHNLYLHSLSQLTFCKSIICFEQSRWAIFVYSAQNRMIDRLLTSDISFDFIRCLSLEYQFLISNANKNGSWS